MAENTFQGFDTAELETWWKGFNETSTATAPDSELEKWFQQYESKFGGDLLRRKHKAAQELSMINSEGGMDAYKKRQARTKELETEGYSVASTLLGKQGSSASSLSSKTLLGS